MSKGTAGPNADQDCCMREERSPAFSLVLFLVTETAEGLQGWEVLLAHWIKAGACMVLPSFIFHSNSVR